MMQKRSEVSVSKLAVLHIALNPVTGVWSVMKSLASAQAESGNYAAVGVGVIKDPGWPKLYTDELQALRLPHYLAFTPKMFGTAQFLWQRIRRPPLRQWIEDLMSSSGADKGIIHFHNAWLSGVFLPLTRSNSGRIQTVATFHGVNAHFRGQPIRRRIHRWMANRLIKYHTLLTSVDEANLSRARVLLGMNPGGFTVIPNGIADTQVRSPLEQNRTKTLTVGHVGSIVAAKGWRLLVDAVGRLRQKGTPVQAVLAGRGDEEGQARMLARQNSDWMTFEGFVPNPRESLLSRLDVLVLMSEQEGLPMAIIEALSVGVPIIATPVGGVPEAVTDGRNGMLIPRSVEALEQALLRLVSDQELRRSMSAEARRTFEDRFEISKIVSRYHALYQGNA
jgi:glycosyltransferase involved in cell wall biosynthesis